MKQSTQEAVDTWINGNKTDFRQWLKRAKKLDVLDAIEYYAGNHGSRHEIIYPMREYLK